MIFNEVQPGTVVKYTDIANYVNNEYVVLGKRTSNFDNSTWIDLFNLTLRTKNSVPDYTEISHDKYSRWTIIQLPPEFPR